MEGRRCFTLRMPARQPAAAAAAWLLSAARVPTDADNADNDRHSPSDPAAGGGVWGFSTRVPPLRDLLTRRDGATAALDTALADSSAYRAPGAPAAMLRAYGGDVQTLTGLSATALAPPVDVSTALTTLRTRLRTALTTAWAADACGRGNAAAAAGNAKSAAAAFGVALTHDPACAAAMVGLGRLAERDGRLHDAVDQFEAAVEAGGGDAAREARTRVRTRLAELGIPLDRGRVLEGRGGRQRSRSRSPVGRRRRGGGDGGRQR